MVSGGWETHIKAMYRRQLAGKIHRYAEAHHNGSCIHREYSTSCRGLDVQEMPCQLSEGTGYRLARPMHYIVGSTSKVVHACCNLIARSLYQFLCVRAYQYNPFNWYPVREAFAIGVGKSKGNYKTRL